ncbi:hypothetical protein ACFFQW_06450 [Umezawaea endophytica]
MTIGHKPPPWWKSLVAVLLVAVCAVVVAVVLDGSGKFGGTRSDSSSTGIPSATEIISGTTEPDIPTSTKTTTTTREYEVGGPVRTGEVELAALTGHDLDRDREAFPREGADVLLDCCALHALAEDEMSFPRGDRPADCLGQPTRQELAVEKLQEHPTLCVVTDQGGLATVHATLVSGPLESSPRVAITYELWTVSR